MATPAELLLDAKLLLDRALDLKTVVAFGEDGLGQFGRHEFPRKLTVCDINVMLTYAEDDELAAHVAMVLTPYNELVDGKVFTDRNLLISIRKLLEAEHIDPTCVSYDLSTADNQPNFGVLLKLDIRRLLDWP